MLQSTLVSSKRRASRVPINGTSFPINSRNIDCFNENTGQSSLQQQQLAVDCASNSVFTASISRASTTKSNCNSLLIHKHTQNTTSYSLSSSLFCSVPIEEAEEQQESLACFDVIEDTLCIAFKQSGLIASLSTVSSTSSSSDDSSCSLDNYEIVAKIESGIACMKWSPDLEVCVIVSHSLKLLLLSRDYDLIYEVVLGSANADSTLHAEQVPVNVGWGKKETQFHGSAGKAAAMEKRTDVYVKADQDDRNDVQIDWRGDANYFVVSAAIDGVRSLRVYNREAILQSLSEPVNNLHQTLSWRPSGNLIAVSQTYTTKIQKVVFFERNGLQHGEFELVNEAPSTTRVVQLTWNLDSTILAVWVERRRSRENTDYLESAILLYTCSNYHYYLAREVRCGKLDSFASIKWDPETANRLHTLTTAGMVKTDNFIFSTYKSTSLSPESPATVAVIDGNILHLTPFKYANTPPPYSHSQVTLPTSANALLASLNGPDRIAVLACDGSIFLVEPQSKQDWRLGYKIVETLNSADIADKVIRADVDADAAPPSIPERIFWIAETLLVVVFDGCVVVCGIKKRVEDEGCIHLETAAVLPFDGCLLECVFDDHQTGFLEVEDGTVYKVWCQDNGKWRMTHFIKFPHPCPLIAPIQLKISEDDYSSSLESLQDTDHVVAAVTEPHLLGQTTTNKLYLDTQIISQDCLSFSAHSEFIIWTALNHHLWTIETGEIKDLHQSVSSLAKMDSNSRRVERGAKIVCAVPGDISVVLMMPRGNLESVCPRPFVLSAVRQALDAKQYRTAFALCRKHRIDLNILYDHAPAAFLEHVLEFVKGVAVPEYLNLFLSGLRNENITESMYPHPCYQKKAGNASLVGETHNNVSKAAASAIVVDDIDDEATFVCKIDRVCAAIRGALQQAASSNSSKYTTCILTTFVKMNEPDLESSMRLIKQIKETLSVEAADQALKYVIFLVNVEALYNVALGMYDFGLVVMVAQQSQKDPREYLPFLTELSKLEKFQQRFRIDDYLGRKEKALINLKQDGDHGACMAYMIKNRLFKTGMTLFEEGSVEFKDVMKAYAHHLFDSREYLDSATLYRSAGFYQKALEAYIEATAWQEALSVIYQVEDGEAKIRDVCTQLIESLEEQYAYESAATIYFEYLLDPESGIKQLCKGYYFTQAVRKAQILRQPVLIAEIIQPAVYAAHVTLKEEIEMAIETVGKQRDRLIQVRVEKAKRLLELSLMPHNEDLNDIEIMSDTSSMATTRISAYSRTNTATTSNQSHASVRSNMSSRTKRKLEKKKHSSKKGGVFEEEFLVNSLIKAAERLKTLNLEVGNVATSMLMFPNSNVMATAREFEAKFQQLDRLLRKSMFKVYPHLAQVVEASRKKKTDDVAEDVATEPLIMPPVESTMPTIPDNVLEFVMIQTNPIKDTTSDLRPAFLKK